MMHFDAFISYSGTDKPTADAVCATLEAAGIRCWIAPRDITPGREYGDALIDALDRCRVLVLVFSARANTSPQIRREVERVVSRGVPVLPLRIENVAPTRSMAYFVGSVHWLDALTPPLEQHLQRLAGAVRALLQVDPEGAGHVAHDPGAAAPDRRPEPPAEQAADRPPAVAAGPDVAVAASLAPAKIPDHPKPAKAGEGVASRRDDSGGGLAADDASPRRDNPAPPPRLEPTATAPATSPPAILPPETPPPGWPAILLLVFGAVRCITTLVFGFAEGSKSRGIDGVSLLLLTELMASGVAGIFVGWWLRRPGPVSATVKIVCGLGLLSELGWLVFSAIIVANSRAADAVLLVCLPAPFGCAAFIAGWMQLRRRQAAVNPGAILAR